MFVITWHHLFKIKHMEIRSCKGYLPSFITIWRAHDRHVKSIIKSIFFPTLLEWQLEVSEKTVCEIISQFYNKSRKITPLTKDGVWDLWKPFAWMIDSFKRFLWSWWIGVLMYFSGVYVHTGWAAALPKPRLPDRISFVRGFTELLA